MYIFRKVVHRISLFSHLVQVAVGVDKDVEVINGAQDDLPCDLCEQLVKHLRDVLIANTTEAEFKLVLQGICDQMKSDYKNEVCKRLNIISRF